MLSENELTGLLDQLKLGALQGVASDADPVGHWPVLIGDGLCLSLQSAARDEFARQPDKVTVVDGISATATLSDVCSQYRQVHHVSTGLQDRSILIGYDHACLTMLPLLREITQNAAFEAEEEVVCSSTAYDFSLAIAASLDPSAHTDGVDHPVAFLPLEFEQETSLVGGWKVRLDMYGQQAEFFVGLLNPMATRDLIAREVKGNSAEIVVKPKTLSRLARSNELTATLTLPEQLACHFPSRSRLYGLRCDDDGIKGKAHAVIDRAPEGESTDVDLMVQQSLQLTADDLYLLLAEAVGVGTHLRLRFDPIDQLTAEYILPAEKPFRCLTINDLPIKNAYLTYAEGELILSVKE